MKNVKFTTFSYVESHTYPILKNISLQKNISRNEII